AHFHAVTDRHALLDPRHVPNRRRWTDARGVLDLGEAVDRRSADGSHLDVSLPAGDGPELASVALLPGVFLPHPGHGTASFCVEWLLARGSGGGEDWLFLHGLVHRIGIVLCELYCRRRGVGRAMSSRDTVD